MGGSAGGAAGPLSSGRGGNGAAKGRDTSGVFLSSASHCGDTQAPPLFATPTPFGRQYWHGHRLYPACCPSPCPQSTPALRLSSILHRSFFTVAVGVTETVIVTVIVIVTITIAPNLR